jgi:sentrin-specific protease 7
VDLVEDDDDEVMEVSQSALSTPAGTFYEIPLSARSSQSRMSVGSGSTMTGNKPSQPKSEFREADGFLRSSQRKPRKSGSNRPQGARRHSPFAGGEMAEGLIVVNKHNPGRTTSTRQTILQDFQQGGSDRSRKEHHHHSAADGYTASHHFPNARINESTAAQTVRDRRLAGEGTELRKLHRPAPKEADMAVDSNSEDELAPSPVDKKTKAMSKAARAANSGVKRKVGQKSGGVGWPLVFARSHDYERRESTFDANKPDLQLRFGHGGWHVKTVDTEGNLKTQFEINSADVIKASADDIGRIRFEGPRRLDSNIHIFDLEFARTPEFIKFRNEFLRTLTKSGTHYPKDE